MRRWVSLDACKGMGMGAWLGAVLLLAACSDKQAPPPPLPPPAAPAPASAEASPAQQVLKTLLSRDGIGLNLAHIEKQAGPAIHSAGQMHRFEIDQCQIEVVTDESNRGVQHVRLALTPQCTATTEGLLPHRPPVPLNSLTFKKLADEYGPGQFLADCLRGCGNAYDPVIYYVAEGSRADGFFKLVLEQARVTDEILEAEDRWVDAMEAQEGEDWLIDAKFNCPAGAPYQALAMEALGHIQPATLSFGESPMHALPRCD